MNCKFSPGIVHFYKCVVRLVYRHPSIYPHYLTPLHPPRPFNIYFFAAVKPIYYLNAPLPSLPLHPLDSPSSLADLSTQTH